MVNTQHRVFPSRTNLCNHYWCYCICRKWHSQLQSCIHTHKGWLCLCYILTTLNVDFWYFRLRRLPYPKRSLLTYQVFTFSTTCSLKRTICYGIGGDHQCRESSENRCRTLTSLNIVFIMDRITHVSKHNNILYALLGICYLLIIGERRVFLMLTISPQSLVISSIILSLLQI